jgi:long-subunit fatty acid transport protein
LLLAHWSFAQQEQNDTSRTHFTFSTGLSGGTGWLGERFTSAYLSGGVSHRLNDKLNLRFGVATGSFNSELLGNYRNKTPYRNPNNRQSAAIGVDYQPNDRLQLSITAFYDNISLSPTERLLKTNRLNTTGINADLTYKLSEGSFLNLNVTFMQSDNPYNFFNPYFTDGLQGFGSPFFNNNFPNHSFFGW